MVHDCGISYLFFNDGKNADSFTFVSLLYNQELDAVQQSQIEILNQVWPLTYLIYNYRF